MDRQVRKGPVMAEQRDYSKIDKTINVPHRCPCCGSDIERWTATGRNYERWFKRLLLASVVMYATWSVAALLLTVILNSTQIIAFAVLNAGFMPYFAAMRIGRQERVKNKEPAGGEARR